MKINKRLNGSELLVELSGRLDTNSSPILENELKDDLNNVKLLIFDFKELMYISSTGLRVILSTQKIMTKQGDMVIKNPNELIMEVFDATGFTDILIIDKT
ncbi:MAG: STAS domain-containing protein [Methanobrevibacter sp.]|jgi:anti-sigma B factor antagonist|nr:STAS domain-containing protein [Candidatus Methanovirga basalitermitum]